MKKVIAVVGARPQFIKHFAFETEAKKIFNLKTIHTGQHYDPNMSQIFFDKLKMKKPDYQLSLGGGNHGAQTGKMMVEIEEIILKEKPDLLVVYGDTNSTLAGALVASKLHIPIGHIEAGLRSFNKEMPEEINRLLTDHVSNLLFVPSNLAVDNLKAEGLDSNIFNVGDIMKDLVINSVQNNWIIKPKIEHDYFFATLHRPYNTDDKSRLQYVLDALNNLSYKTVFSIHPRTRNAMKDYNLFETSYPNILFINPQPYFENLGLLHFSKGLITDSGGMQKEAYWLKKPCVTIRKETEWTETLESDANILIFDDLTSLNQHFSNDLTKWDNTLYGDGETALNIVKHMDSFLQL